MSDITITLDRRGVRAVSLFAARQDIRYYLQGVLVEATSDATRLVATNGHVMGLHHSTQSNTVSEPTSIIVPIGVITLIGRETKRNRALKPALMYSKVGGWVLRTWDGTVRFGFDPIEGKFPRYSNIVPETVSGQTALINPIYTGLMGKVATELGRDPQNVAVHFNGENSAVATVQGRPEFVGVMMPMRKVAFDSYARPLWLADRTKVPA